MGRWHGARHQVLRPRVVGQRVRGLGSGQVLPSYRAGAGEAWGSRPDERLADGELGRGVVAPGRTRGRAAGTHCQNGSLVKRSVLRASYAFAGSVGSMPWQRNWLGKHIARKTSYHTAFLYDFSQCCDLAQTQRDTSEFVLSGFERDPRMLHLGLRGSQLFGSCSDVSSLRRLLSGAGPTRRADL